MLVLCLRQTNRGRGVVFAFEGLPDEFEDLPERIGEFGGLDDTRLGYFSCGFYCPKFGSKTPDFQSVVSTKIL